MSWKSVRHQESQRASAYQALVLVNGRVAPQPDRTIV